jgi:hypothetical protein
MTGDRRPVVRHGAPFTPEDADEIRAIVHQVGGPWVREQFLDGVIARILAGLS